MTCGSCGALLSEELRACSKCGAPRGSGGLVLGGGLDRVMETSLAQLESAMLTREHDTLDALLLTLDTDVATPVSTSDLRLAFDKIHQDSAGQQELEGLLDFDNRAVLDGIRLTDLLEKGGEDEKMLRKGLVFLKKRRYDVALEWWSLHRAQLAPTQRRLELLLLLLEAYTLTLANQLEKAGKVRELITSHPLFDSYVAKAKGLARSS